MTSLVERLRYFTATAELVQTLEDVGLTVEHIATATEGSVLDIEAWAVGNAYPETHAAIALDDLRTTSKFMLEAGRTPKEVSEWFLEPHDVLDGTKPIQLIATNPVAVLKAAVGDDLDESIRRHE